MDEDLSLRYYDDTPPPPYGAEGVETDFREGPATDVSDLYVTTDILSGEVSQDLSDVVLGDNEVDVYELLSCSAEIADAAAESLRKIEAAVVARGETFGDVFDQVLAVYAYETERAPHDYETELLKVDLLVQTASELDRDNIARLVAEVNGPLTEACTAEEVLLPVVNDTLAKLQDEVIGTTDWDTVIAKAVDGEDYLDFSEHIAVVAAGQPSDDPGLQEALSRVEYTTALRQRIADNGNRLPEGQNYHVSDNVRHVATLPDDINRWSQKTRAAIVVFSTARVDHIARIDPHQKLTALFTMAAAAGLGKNRDVTRVAPEIAHALYAHADALIADFEAADMAWVRETLGQLPAEISVENEKLATDKIGILNVQSWVQDRLRRYTEHMTRGIRGVRFVDDSSYEVVGGAALRTYGSLGIDDGIVEVNVNSSSLADAHDSLDHEIWHNFEKNMSLADLREWAEICAEEHGAAHDGIPDNIEPELQASESLAYCGEVYMNEPVNLLERNLHRRFAFLQARVGRYSADDIRVQIATIDQNGHFAHNISMANRILVRRADKATEKSWQSAA